MLRARQRLGKYRIEGRIAKGGYADVYRAYDTIEGTRVALKIPHAHHTVNGIPDGFRREAKLAATLDHPAVLPLKNADLIDGHFVITYPLGLGTLADRLTKRMSVATGMAYTAQMVDAIAHAHQHNIIHCDIKPENFILFEGERVRLADFGIARLGASTMLASGSGTIGYIAPEQALGKPSFRSDVFSLGLVVYRLFSGMLPTWPFTWPPPHYAKLVARLHPYMLAFLRRCLHVDEAKRYDNGVKMREAFLRVQRLLANRQSTGAKLKRRKTDMEVATGKPASSGATPARPRQPAKKAASGKAAPRAGMSTPVRRKRS